MSYNKSHVGYSVSAREPYGTSVEPVRMIVFGGTGVGKSTFVNDASRSSLEVGHDLASKTKLVHTSQIFQIDGRNVQLYDTPGFDDTELTDTQMLKVLADTLEGMHKTGQNITGLIYLHRITDNRFTGASVRALELFMRICGLSNMRNVMIVTNMWSQVPDPEEERREQQLRSDFFLTALQNGARLARRGGPGSESARGIVREMLRLSPVELQLQTELANGSALSETQAGILVEQNLRVRLERQRREKEELEEELEAARQDRDRRAQEQLERYKRDREDEEERLRRMIEELKEARRSVPKRAVPSTSNGGAHIVVETPQRPDMGQDRASGTKWLSKFSNPGRISSVRGRDPARSAALSDGQSVRPAENRPQGRARLGTPVGRKGVFTFRSRFKMMYSRKSQSEIRG